MPAIYVGGHYTATWSGADIGTTETGFRIHMRQHESMVKDDAFGEMDADGFQAGVDYEIEVIAIEWSKFKAVMAGQMGTVGITNDNVGKLLTTLAQSLVLTPIAGTPAASYGNVHTATKSILIGDIDWENKFNLRKINARFRCFPDTSNSNKAIALT